jgi:predicted MPP superfamily phosphohydrolase
MNNKIRASGYTLLNNEFTKISIGTATIGMIGITTMGRHPNIIHGNVADAIKGLDSVDLKILLSHDPNQWDESVKNKTDINITFSGHTHGMQMGIITKNFRWSPAKHYYPHWNGMYSENGQIQYVNRGLGVLAIPFRIWMPPEITVITLKSE